MEKLKLVSHKHPLLPFSRFSREECEGCRDDYIYGGYRCNELECEYVIHRECAEPLPEINHSSHPDHPLKLLQSDKASFCSRCRQKFHVGYICSICYIWLDLRCAKESAPILQNSNLHEHPLYLTSWSYTKSFKSPICENDKFYECRSPSCSSEVFFSVECVFPIHTSHPQHPLKLLTVEATPVYAVKKCLLCQEAFDHDNYKLYHCDVCNFSICPGCMKHPPPIVLKSPTTHEHELHLVPRRIEFTCNACGTLGDRSPYFCLQCNFMIHRQCIDLPRVININRHDHRISYTPRLGHGEWKCKICREKVDGFYGAYTCAKCPTFVAHSLCATRKDIWDMVELEGMAEEAEEIPPFEVIDANTIKHFSHDHNLLRVNKDDHDHIEPENIVCEACRLQILSEPFYSCKQCHFVLHQKCANHPRKKRHVYSNKQLTLRTDSHRHMCEFCRQYFTGFNYSDYYGDFIDVRCAAISDTIEHESHQHPLHYKMTSKYDDNICRYCGDEVKRLYRCDDCKDYILCVKCAQYPKKVMRKRYDDHPLSLSFGDMNVEGHYWCEACETKVKTNKWFYTYILHIPCVVGDYSYLTQCSYIYQESTMINGKMVHPEIKDGDVVSNTSICRPFCFVCNSRCKLPYIFKDTFVGVDFYYCSIKCGDSQLE